MPSLLAVALALAAPFAVRVERVRVATGLQGEQTTSWNFGLASFRTYMEGGDTHKFVHVVRDALSAAACAADAPPTVVERASAPLPFALLGLYERESFVVPARAIDGAGEHGEYGAGGLMGIAENPYGFYTRLCRHRL